MMAGRGRPALRKKLLFAVIHEKLPKDQEAYKTRPWTIWWDTKCYLCGKKVPKGTKVRVVFTRDRGTKWSNKRMLIICPECEVLFYAHPNRRKDNKSESKEGYSRNSEGNKRGVEAQNNESGGSLSD